MTWRMGAKIAGLPQRSGAADRGQVAGTARAGVGKNQAEGRQYKAGALLKMMQYQTNLDAQEEQGLNCDNMEMQKNTTLVACESFQANTT